MARIKDNYASHNKEDLLAEINARKIEGHTMATHKDDMIAALELNDDGAAEEEEEKPPVSESPEKGDDKDAEISKLRKQVEELEAAKAKSFILPGGALAGSPPIVADPNRKDLDTFKKGTYKDRSTGEEFVLKVIPESEAENGRTHLLANKEHFREITEERFNATMEKV